MQNIIWNPNMSHYECIQCSQLYSLEEDMFEGCPVCARDHEPSSVKPVYQESWSKDNLLPFRQHITMGEGGTPLLPLNIEQESVYIKLESQNPTGSHKDRMSAYVVSMARSRKYKGMVIASSGNAGLSVASYAAFAGLPCVLIATPHLNEELAKVIQATGAVIVWTDTSMERWERMKDYVNDGYFPASNYINPPVGTMPVGVQAYKMIAREIYEDFSGQIPSQVIVPSSRGDLLWGIYEGFQELNQTGKTSSIPQMIAVEPFPRLKRVLEGESYTGWFEGATNLVSINGQTVTRQLDQAVRESRGEAVVIDEKQSRHAQEQLHRSGMHLELSSAAALAAYYQTMNKYSSSSTVIIGTSSFFTPI